MQTQMTNKILPSASTCSYIAGSLQDLKGSLDRTFIASAFIFNSTRFASILPSFPPQLPSEFLNRSPRVFQHHLKQQNCTTSRETPNQSTWAQGCVPPLFFLPLPWTDSRTSSQTKCNVRVRNGDGHISVWTTRWSDCTDSHSYRMQQKGCSRNKRHKSGLFLFRSSLQLTKYSQNCTPSLASTSDLLPWFQRGLWLCPVAEMCLRLSDHTFPRAFPSQEQWWAVTWSSSWLTRPGEKSEEKGNRKKKKEENGVVEIHCSRILGGNPLLQPALCTTCRATLIDPTTDTEQGLQNWHFMQCNSIHVKCFTFCSFCF